MISQIPIQRWILYFLILSLLPMALVIMNLLSKNNEISQIETLLASVQLTQWQQEQKQSQNLSIYQHYREADHFYIDRKLETLTFLEDEVESLQKIVSNSTLGQMDTITKRLEVLKGPANRLQFTEGVVQTYPYFQETLETLAHTVEVNVEDIKKILSFTEGINSDSFPQNKDRPQLIITEFKIDKKQVREKKDVFVLNMKILKREFL